MVFRKKINTISSQKIPRLLWILLCGNTICDTSFCDAITNQYSWRNGVENFHQHHFKISCKKGKWRSLLIWEFNAKYGRETKWPPRCTLEPKFLVCNTSILRCRDAINDKKISLLFPSVLMLPKFSFCYAIINTLAAAQLLLFKRWKVKRQKEKNEIKNSMDDLETSSVTRIININTVPQHRYLFLEKEAENSTVSCCF